MAKVILVTGATSGIGKTTATYLSQKGYIVYGTARDISTLENPTFKLLKMDVSDPDTVGAAVEKIIDDEGRIDVLINNAGIGMAGPVEEISNVEVERLFAINFYGPINLMKATLPHMRLQKQGLIINITSIAGYIGLPYRGAYCASKSALETLTESVRMEVKPFGISIVNLAPGDFATNIGSRRYHAPMPENSPYAAYGSVLAKLSKSVKDGANPLMVAKKIDDIINTKNPNIHYKVGAFGQLVAVALKRILPDTVFERLIMNHYKL